MSSVFYPHISLRRGQLCQSSFVIFNKMLNHYERQLHRLPWKVKIKQYHRAILRISKSMQLKHLLSAFYSAGAYLVLAILVSYLEPSLLLYWVYLDFFSVSLSWDSYTRGLREDTLVKAISFRCGQVPV